MPVQSARAQRWRAVVADWWADAWRWVLMAAGMAIAVYLLLDRNVPNGAATAAAVAGLVVGVVLTGSKPMAIALMAVPALFITQRMGFGAGALSVSDVALAAGFGTAVLLGDRHYSRPLRMLLWANLLYQFATLFTVIVNPQTANTVEWFHAWLLVSGALIVGWALGRGGYAPHGARPHGLRDSRPGGRHDLHRDLQLLPARGFRRRLSGMAVGDAQERSGHAHVVRHPDPLCQSRRGRGSRDVSRGPRPPSWRSRSS